jgi:hypothetical protein
MKTRAAKMKMSLMYYFAFEVLASPIAPPIRVLAAREKP